jgi:dsRNA-specific ribonuclease
MEHGNGAQDTPLHTLIPLEDFKAILGVDDREDTLSRYCLITATYTIEQYCKRRLFLKKHFERIEFHGDLLLPLREE